MGFVGLKRCSHCFKRVTWMVGFIRFRKLISDHFVNINSVGRCICEVWIANAGHSQGLQIMALLFLTVFIPESDRRALSLSKSSGFSTNFSRDRSAPEQSQKMGRNLYVRRAMRKHAFKISGVSRLRSPRGTFFLSLFYSFYISIYFCILLYISFFLPISF